MQREGKTHMKNMNNQQTKCTQPHIKTGSITTQIKTLLHLNPTNTLTINKLNQQTFALTDHEKETKAYEIEAELKKASARTYANPSLIK